MLTPMKSSVFCPFPRRRLGGKRLLAAACALSLAALVTLAPAGALAQAGSNPEIQSLLNRIERLQRDMNTLQRQVYRGGAPAASSGDAPSNGETPAAIGASTEPNLAATMQVRLDEIETQMRAFTGRLEESNHAIAELTKKLELLTSDIDVRFKTAGAPGAAAAQGGAPATPPAVAAAPTTRGVLGTIPLTDLDKKGAAAANDRKGAAGASGVAPTEQTASVLPKGSAQDQYRYATSFLAKSDWGGAERALKAFLEAHPKGELSGNAQYWLGESYYVRGDYNNAALAFAKGYKDFPRSAKGPDNLLKLGLSLANLKKTQSACASFDRMAKDFPKAPNAIKSRVSAERKKLRCE